MGKSAHSRLVALLTTIAILSLLSPALFAETATVTRPANLRADHDASSALVKHLGVSTSLTLLDTAPQNGYLHVRTADGDEGWVYAKNVSVSAQRQPAHHAKSLSARAASARSRSTAPCFPTLDTCPDDGCAQRNTADALLNHRKRNLVTDDGSAVTLTFADLRSLQDTTESKGVPQAAGIKDRSVLTGIDIGGGRQLSEGQLVQVAGFISPDRTLVKGSAESVNCRLTAEHDTDVHIPIVETAEGNEFESFVAEPIPQNRSATWTVTRWKQTQANGTRVLVRGQLMYDNKHFVNDDPADPKSGQPKRFTLWEIHPITAFFECGLPSNDCDPSHDADWIRVN